MLLLWASGVHAQSVCSNPPNEIVAENCLPGNPPSEWDIEASGDLTIQGFATDISVNRGEPIGFKVKTDSADYRLDIYRIGYYNGDGARLVAVVQPQVALPQNQPDCLVDSSTRLVDCGNWGLSATWTPPANAVSGVYIARLVREDSSPGASHIIFVVRDEASDSDLLFQTSDTTWQAYNSYGGWSLYTETPTRAYKVSYNRPFVTRNDNARSFFFSAEYPMVRWLERNGFDITYSTGVDTHRRGSKVLDHNVFLSVGHDEYWSGTQRANIETARDNGVNLVFASGNEVFWKIRWEDSIDGSGTPNRTLVCYKETRDNAKIDPSPEWTGTWRDPRFSPPSNGGRPENALTGTMFTVDADRFDTMLVDDQEGKLRFWRNTDLQTLPAGTVSPLTPGALGYEWNSDIDNGSRPAGLIRLSSTSIIVNERLLDYGATVGAGAESHSMTLYRDDSGALVFGAGSVRYSWALDGTHDNVLSEPDWRVQQATINLFADMGVQPGALQQGLVPAQPSLDTSPPAAAILVPSSGATTVVGSIVTFSGSATDYGGGIVGAVEISLDGGGTWHPAEGRGSWSYAWVPRSEGTIDVVARAVDDSGNIGPVSGAITLQVDPADCPCSTWHPSEVPGVQSVDDPSPTELGLRFQPLENGVVTGVRFFKGPLNTGVHTGSLWTATGDLLAHGSFTSETASGWQELTFSAPIAVVAGDTYVVSYFAPNGGYAFTGGYFLEGPLDTPPIRALDGVFRGGSGFPNGTYVNANYWVDVAFVAGDGMGFLPFAGDDYYYVNQDRVLTISNPGLLSNDTDPASQPLAAVKLSDPANGSVVVQQDGSFTYTPDPGFQGVDSFTYLATDGVRQSNTASATIEVLLCPPCALWSDSATPALASANDTAAIELGLRFRASENGSLLGVRFYKGPLNTGTHTGSLWSGDGSLIANTTFNQESAEGWQEALFDTPAPIIAGQTYVISYYAPNGGYAIDGAYFTTATMNEPLMAFASIDGGNGVYRYGPSGFPASTSGASNYWVDPVFSPDLAPNFPPIANADQYQTQEDRPLSVIAPGLLANDLEPNNDAMSVLIQAGPSNGVLEAQPDGSFVYTPNNGFVGIDSFQYVAFDGQEVSSVVPVTMTVTQCPPCSVWTDDTLPAYESSSDTATIELGMKFTLSEPGFVSGVRFYKGAQNIGTHIGHLWSSDGVLLGSVTFTNETATGWQTAQFVDPVPVSAGVQYVVSYLAPNGGYAFDDGFFSAAIDRNPIMVPESPNNGVFHYGGGFPNSSFGGANYWVDLQFTPGVSNAPLGVDDSYALSAGETLSISAPGVLGNDMDPQGEPLSANLVSSVSNGTLTFNDDGSFEYIPNPQFAGSESFTYQASDGFNLSAVTAVTLQVKSCPCTLFELGESPSVPSAADPGPLELGVKFESAMAGSISGIRFYKGPSNGGEHIANLWTGTGKLLATATFLSETASGWQQVDFASPVTIVPGVTYIASYYAPQGGYSYTPGYFSTEHVSFPLRALANGEFGGNGVYRYGPSAFPNNGGGASNYWVDVVFTPGGAAPSAADDSYEVGQGQQLAIPAPGVLWNDSFSGAATAVKLTDPSNGIVNLGSDGSFTYQPDPEFVGVDAFTYAVSSSTGTSTPATVSLTVSPCPCTIWTDFDIPAIESANDPSAVELGFKFRPLQNGFIKGVRFYKGPLNGGVHTVSLWTREGVLLATTTVSSETSSGWQEALFASPVAVTADTTYVASYHAPEGGYALTPQGFAASAQTPYLRALANGEDGGNGLYRYGSSAFPNNSYNQSNYWVDVVFDTAP